MNKLKPLTLQELIDALHDMEVPSDSPVIIEGCDCVCEVGFVAVYDGQVWINRADCPDDVPDPLPDHAKLTAEYLEWIADE